MLRRAGWTARAPLLAMVTYLAAAWSVVAALGLAGLTLAVHAPALRGGLSHLIGACVLRLRATYATPGGATVAGFGLTRSEEHTTELQSRENLVCRLLLEKKKQQQSQCHAEHLQQHHVKSAKANQGK